MTQPFRLAKGGIVDRSRSLIFQFDGARHQGYAGDTLASALLANGIHLVARSFKYHRPRGVFSAGTEEPNAMVQLARGARTEPNVRATTQELYDGLTASSQNCWPSVRFDIGAINNAISRLIPAGFYYKTFMWPPTPKWWLKYEHAIRQAAGMGRAASEADPDHYEHRYAHCDVLVIGGGITGLASASAAAQAGARVIVCDESAFWGGGICDTQIDGKTAPEWIDTKIAELNSYPDVTLLSRTTAFGYYDGNLVGAVERITDHLASAPTHKPRQRLWKIRARTAVLASGAIERPIAYANNDLPGTMLSGAARVYVTRYGVRPGSRAVIFTNNDGGYADAAALNAAGIAVAAIVDARPASSLSGLLVAKARAAGLPSLADSVIVKAHGTLHVAAVDIATSGAPVRRIECDLVCVSGGWNPAVHLFSQARGKLRYDDELAAFVPESSPLPITPAGAANGCFDVANALAEGYAAGVASAERCGFAAPRHQIPRSESTERSTLLSLWSVPARSKSDKCFVDLQNDVTVSDIALSARENYQSIEHLKRYTTLGMGTDQGKTSNVIGLALMAKLLEVPISKVGTTTFRPPYTPVTLGAIAGHEAGPYVEPTRFSAIHDWHVKHGARFINVGLWKRPHSYPGFTYISGESGDDAANREARNVRTSVGVVDVSTLGKIELQGKDVAKLLNRVYINKWDTLAVGRCRYGVMLREDGI
ncbi:MAG TPA: 2Fe-2S iron-sulfur cluster-binding protein, partial [Burkholderiaceae bacterium]|nr:2Fe-2S iron-sulfur cluster-binding protein [Burkholderiaceae bacterium]